MAYDSKAVKIPKAIKVQVALRRTVACGAPELFKMWTAAIQEANRRKTRSNREKDAPAPGDAAA